MIRRGGSAGLELLAIRDANGAVGQSCGGDLERLGGLDEPALFINQAGTRLREHALSCGVQRLARRCGLGRVTLHQFRHSCASDLLEGGIQLPAVQQLLGHQTITTTVRYLHIADPHRRAAVRLHPINDMLGAAGGAA